MSALEQPYPFRRLWVDHAVEGVTRIWWSLAPEFVPSATPGFVLQVSPHDNPDAPDWVDVGGSTTGNYATDSRRRLYGQRLDSFYRVRMTDGSATYVSRPVEPYGVMSESNWLVAREILRKERLAAQQSARSGYLLQLRGYGRICPQCVDRATKTVTESQCTVCCGVGLVPPYLPAIPGACWQLSARQIKEQQDSLGPGGASVLTQVKARVPGLPLISVGDVWVDARTDERYLVRTATPVAEVQGVPVVVEAVLHLIPMSAAVYRWPLGGEPDDSPRIELATVGTGTVRVTHDYGAEDAFALQTADGCGVAGAVVRVFTLAGWEANARDPDDAVVETATDINGRWISALLLDPGDYILQFEKPGAIAAVTAELTVDPTSSDSVSTPEIDYFRSWD